MKRAILCWLAASLSAFGGLTFDQTSKEVDTDVEALSVTIDFTFKNTGTEPVKIDRYDAGCSCVNVALQGGKTFYKPGESGTLRSIFDLSGFSGRAHKQIMIWLDGAPAQAKPSYLLDIHANIPVLMELEPRTVTWDINAIAEPKTVVITVKGDDPVRIQSISESSKFVRELKTIEEGRKYELTIVPQSTDKADFNAFRIETDSPAKRYKTQLVFAAVQKPGVKEVNGDTLAPGASPRPSRRSELNQP